MDAHHTVQTPRSAVGAIAMIRVVHDDPQAIGLIDPKMGSVRLGNLFDIDEGVILRLDEHSIMLMPHGGIAIVRAISQALAERGVEHRECVEPCEIYREAESEVEAWMLYALSQASSPLAVDLLLDQPARWASVGVRLIHEAKKYKETADDNVLGRLIEPPIVAAVGRANVGKSTLINALAGQQIAIVADMPGTTRDHVGVLVDLGGLVVRWIDTPGIDERIADGEEIELARRIVAQAQCVVQCIDSNDDSGTLDDRLESVIGANVSRVRVGTRADLGRHCCRIDAAVSIGENGQMVGLELLVSQIKESLVPASALADSRPWAFWSGIRV
ncbi:hypothetical protein COB72_04925 [bacterium]|nr:MAG: hypothetical protein COB72_04925 [bacterium]